MASLISLAAFSFFLYGLFVAFPFALGKAQKSNQKSNFGKVLFDKFLPVNHFKSSFESYKRNLISHPIKTKAITSFVGDILAQNTKYGIDSLASPQLDFQRLFKMASFGLLVHGPCCHYVTTFLENTFPGRRPRMILSKLCVDQFIWSPIFTCLLLLYTGLYDGQSIIFIISSFRSKVWTSFLTSLLIWPWINIIAFLYVPVDLRILLYNCVISLYSTFLSFISNT